MTGELEVIHQRTELQPAQGETWELFTDGASCAEGAGAGLILTSPSGKEHTYALRFNFDVKNNEAEYETLLAGLNITHKLNIAKLHAYVDSQLVSNQFNGSFDAHELSMQKYLKLLKETAEKFKHFELVQVSRSQNKKADALSKLAALTFSHFQKQVCLEELPNKAIDGGLIVTVIEEVQPNWMNPIIENLRNNTLPEDKNEARVVRERSPMYTIENDILYRKSYYGLLMRCVGPVEAEMIIEEVHSGSSKPVSRCGKNSYKVQKLPKAPQNKKSRHDMIPFTKWVKAKALRTITGVQVQNFVWEYIICRFSIPREIVSDNGAQIAKDPFKSWCEELSIVLKFTSIAHPQANGLFEVTNRDIVCGIKKRLNEKRTRWIDELSNVLWAHCTTFKKSTGETPFSLVYGSEAMIPVEILVPTHRVTNFDETTNNDALCENLNFVEERRLMAAIKEANNKQQIAKYYNKKVRVIWPKRTVLFVPCRQVAKCQN
ncbi:uncharacterized protein [Rutidosis leptorrhynchoides]|uniref:uncharacterized protein n=1 Tax=Rutidosis leptorrhynchoides TaxID=125765 RepID=UPI003A999DE2